MFQLQDLLWTGQQILFWGLIAWLVIAFPRKNRKKRSQTTQ